MSPHASTIRRTLAVGLVALVATTLVGCIRLPSVAPVASQPAASPTATSAPASSEPAEEPASEEPASEAPATSDPADAGADGLGPFTVDDGAGDTWTYTVTGYELPTQIESGAVPGGMEAVSLVLDATHDDGSASWSTCFEVQVVTDSGTYSSMDEASLGVAAVNDVYGQYGPIVGGRAIVAVPAGTTTGSFLVVSRFGDDVREFPFSE